VRQTRVRTQLSHQITVAAGRCERFESFPANHENRSSREDRTRPPRFRRTIDPNADRHRRRDQGP
jgi:hypothetical protein